MKKKLKPLRNYCRILVLAGLLHHVSVFPHGQPLGLAHKTFLQAWERFSTLFQPSVLKC